MEIVSWGPVNYPPHPSWAVQSVTPVEGTVDELVTFLEGCVDEDERVARDAQQRETVSRRMVGGRMVDVPSQPLPEWRRSVWPPARVLREVEAKRRRLRILVAEYDGVVGEAPTIAQIRCEQLFCIEALTYADRPGYREEWRP